MRMKKLAIALLMMLSGIISLSASEAKSILLHINIASATGINLILEASSTDGSGYQPTSLDVDLVKRSVDDNQGTAYFRIIDASIKNSAHAVTYRVSATASPFEHSDVAVGAPSIATTISADPLTGIVNPSITDGKRVVAWHADNAAGAPVWAVTYLQGQAFDYSVLKPELGKFAVSWPRSETVISGSYTSTITMSYVVN